MSESGQPKRSPNGQPALENERVISIRFGPQTDVLLSQGSASALIREAIQAAVDNVDADLYIDGQTPPDRAIERGQFESPRTVRVEQALIEDLKTLVEQGYANGLSHGIRRAVRDHLSIDVGGDA